MLSLGNIKQIWYENNLQAYHHSKYGCYIKKGMEALTDFRNGNKVIQE